jgi:hypothetical protein
MVSISGRCRSCTKQGLTPKGSLSVCRSALRARCGRCPGGGLLVAAGGQETRHRRPHLEQQLQPSLSSPPTILEHRVYVCFASIAYPILAYRSCIQSSRTRFWEASEKIPSRGKLNLLARVDQWTPVKLKSDHESRAKAVRADVPHHRSTRCDCA